ncbi:DUF2065 domain-containing protein [Pelagibaculum spongiae]|uniref:DUF2065 domain-containing protein n=1 Tax=Pelagibaculum spongiae TaxID=2080658 RepID=A0A2V1GXP6_9GAMM|nr:DUF2065 domain-containing protein [Pelagibaculum spongiae]PVZ70413.1 DUF2065 domain-containing protein [Pelagibaculum spongiae]
MNDLWSALALVLVIEGILPFIAPARWKAAMTQAASQNNRFLQLMGLASMTGGLMLLYMVR